MWPLYEKCYATHKYVYLTNVKAIEKPITNRVRYWINVFYVYIVWFVIDICLWDVWLVVVTFYL